MGPCLNATVDCLFFQDCTEHWSGVCPGRCELSTWSKYVIVWTCIGAVCALILCLRCEFCPLNKVFCADVGGNGPGGGLASKFKGPDYNRQVSGAASLMGGSSIKSHARPNSSGISSLSQVVLVRSMSQETY